MGKIGEGSFSAWMRQGLKELRALFYPESNIAQPTEYGMYGTLTQGEVAEARRHDAWGRREPGRESPDMDRDL